MRKLTQPLGWFERITERGSPCGQIIATIAVVTGLCLNWDFQHMSTPTPTRKPLLTTALQGDPFLFDNTFDPTPSSQSTLSTPLSREDAIEMAYLWDFLWQKIANSGNHLFLSKQSIVFNRDNDWSFTLLKAGKRYHYEAQTQTLTHPLWLPPKAHALKYLAGF